MSVVQLTLSDTRPSGPDPIDHVIAGVRPFFAAFNRAAKTVDRPFFLQLDEDMLLDPDGLARLRDCMAPDVAVAVGHLRDPLQGRIQGIKLFRTEVARQFPFRDVHSPDLDFAERARAAGWRTAWARRPDPDPRRRDTLGQHSPDYTPDFTFAKFHLEGHRLSQRQARGAFLELFEQIAEIRHFSSPWALLGLASGLFSGPQPPQRPAELPPPQTGSLPWSANAAWEEGYHRTGLRQGWHPFSTLASIAGARGSLKAGPAWEDWFACHDPWRWAWRHWRRRARRRWIVARYGPWAG